jgi:hypothetical protein
MLNKYTQECNFAQAVEGDIDDSHLSYLHRNLAELKSPDDFEGKVHYLAIDRSPRLLAEPTDYGVLVANRRDADTDSYYWRVQQFLLPWYTTVWDTTANPRHLKDPSSQRRFQGQIWVPVDDEHTEVWGYIWSPNEDLTDEERNTTARMASFDSLTGRLRATRANHFLQDRNAQKHISYTGISGGREQDAAVQSGMGPIVDRMKEHLGASDTAIIAMRRSLLNEAKALMKGKEPSAPHRPGLYRVRPWHAVMPKGNPSPAAFFSDREVLELTAPSTA